MSATGRIPTGEELQRHARSIGRLAHALLRDEGAAEDVVQDACVAALTRPPDEEKLGPWLRTVLRNFVRQHHRGRARRAQRELDARPPSAPEAPDAFVLRLEAEQRLTSELASLDERFRSVLILRFYEDLAPAEIAARLALPGGTVRWRLMRGLALLRERLDRAHGGDRRAWSLALVRLARLDGGAGVGAAATAVVLPGVLLMNVLKVSAAAVAVLVLALGLSLSGLWPEPLSLAQRERPLEVEFRSLEPAPRETPALARATEERPEPERVAIAAEPDPEAASAAAPEAAAIDARFFGRDGALNAARLVVRHGGARREALSAGPTGMAACSFPLAEPRALVRVELSALGYASEERSAVCERGGTTHLGRIELAPGGAVSGRLVDEHGVGLGDCRVTLGSLEVPRPELEAARLSPAPDAFPSCTSDADGRFRLLGVAPGMQRLWGHATGRKAAYSPPFEVRAGQESTGVELVLEPVAPENRIHGIVLDPGGDPVPLAPISYRHTIDGGDSVTGGESRADQRGRFEFLLPEGARSWLRASDPAGRWSEGTLSDVETGTPELVLQLRAAREFELVVQDASRAPLTSFAVELRGVDRSADMEGLTEELGAERAAELVAELAPRLGGLPRGEHEGGRARLALPAEPFFLRVLAPAHRVLQLGPLEPAGIGATLECTLEPVPGLPGVVLQGGAPAPGVRVELLAEVEADLSVVVDGYRQRLHPDVHDETRTDAEGRFLLTAHAPGSFFVRATPETGAPAEIGPVAVDAALGGPPVELVLRTGGAIEGRVRLEGGADPEGAIVGITRGDGADRTLRVQSDGRFRFEGLLPGPWRIELRDEEVFGKARSVLSNSGPAVQPFDLAANCTVYEGETTFVDVSDAAPGSVLLEGRLTIDERPALGWTARLGPLGRLEFDEGAWTPLDAGGRFELRADAPGEYRLVLRKQGGDLEEQLLFDDVDVGGDYGPWERELHTGKLRLTGPVSWDGEGTPRAVHYWKGPGRLFGLAVPVGESSIDVPAGPSELRAPTQSQDPEDWRILRKIDVPRAAELRVELKASELDGG